MKIHNKYEKTNGKKFKILKVIIN